MDFLHTMAEDCIISYGLGDWCFPKNTKMCIRRTPAMTCLRRNVLKYIINY